MSNEGKDKKQADKHQAIDRRNLLLGTSTLVAAATLTSDALAQAQTATPAASPAPAAPSGRKPNILVIFGDDVGVANISAYSSGLMGYETPSLDRIAREGIRFLHYYGEQSCTAGRAAFLTGQHGIRTGLTKVGYPGAPMGMSQLDPSIGGLLKNLGYATGQFGKNHVGDRNESLPTVNGFDEFFGNLYHLNAEEEPELPDYPKDPAYRAKFGPRGVLRCKASDRDDPTEDPRFGKIGKQTIEDTGALTKKRMETIDDETSAAAIDFMKRQQSAGKPFFCWYNATRMHLRTHVRAEHRGRYKYGDSEYIDGMMEHDDTVGSLLKALDDMGVANDTIVVYSSDNGPHMNTWPDGAMTWFRSEKNTNWEGAFRVPCLVRWPGVIKPGTVTNELMSHNDWVPTLCAAAGEPDIVNKLKAGYTANGISYKVHLDGYDQSQFLRNVSGTAGNNNGTKSARNTFFYSDDDGLLVAIRQGEYKYTFSEQRLQGTMGVWAEPFTTLRMQKIYNLFQDPFERADITSNTYWDWLINHVGGVYGTIDEVAVFAVSLKEFPPRSFPPSFNPATIVEEITSGIKDERSRQGARQQSIDRIRANLRQMIDQQIQQRMR
ncbi:sulfatase-like hydrolase/transferase [Bradyrhizobium jicamae]|uniref:Sulfatase-like hydrolase/transferase n=1 Tax=Bradyrhizobium jicamae TaxID=280332 RepID=A0ABS5FPF8_9BRAD|nr:sulfatase-like hydrolase/transferase [Bradyrhizobium jicamae]MBR0798534.1 sulfatase-like hydrolase/transferase [Bradyrhizobium jicamae]